MTSVILHHNSNIDTYSTTYEYHNNLLLLLHLIVADNIIFRQHVLFLLVPDFSSYNRT